MFLYYPTAWELGRAEGLTSTQLLVLLAIAEHANDEAVCWPSQQRLADMTRLGLRCVRDALKTLEALGFIERTPRWARSGGGRTSDLISLCIPKAEPAAGLVQGGNSPRVPAARRAGEPHIEPNVNEEEGGKEDEVRRRDTASERELLGALQQLVEQGEAEWVEDVPASCEIWDYTGETPRG